MEKNIRNIVPIGHLANRESSIARFNGAIGTIIAQV
jgi:hypothetical protein